jgi:hypothetical protein
MAHSIQSRVTRTTGDAKYAYEIFVDGTGYKLASNLSNASTAYDAMVADVKTVIASFAGEAVDQINTSVKTV